MVKSSHINVGWFVFPTKHSKSEGSCKIKLILHIKFYTKVLLFNTENLKKEIHYFLFPAEFNISINFIQ